MHLYSVICLLGLGTLAAAECCGNLAWCEDGTQGTPCCGRGPCNIFCCNCDGGCRSKSSLVPGTAQAAAPPQFPIVRRAPSEACSYDTTFDAVSGVGSEVITLADYLVWVTSYRPSSAANATEMDTWIRYFYRFDRNGDGKLTLDEIHQPYAKRNDL